MAYSLIIVDKAEHELREAVQWYEAQQAGLGTQLKDDFDLTLMRILDNPFAYRVKVRQMRSARLKQFDVYAVYYRVIAESVVVFSFFHASRNPKSLNKTVLRDNRE
jgi:plasmid stabilization system protein ParE